MTQRVSRTPIETMRQVNRSALVTYPAGDMFALVEEISHSLVDAFTRRARVVYASPP